MRAVLAISLSYLCGSIPFGVLLARHRGVNLRDIGSGNIGATNAARALGKRTGLLVLLLDAAKATLPILVCRRLFACHPARDWLLCTVAAAGVLGHVFSVFLRFRGGKGVATALGAFLGLQPIAAALGVFTYALGYAVTRISSVGSLLAAASFPAWLLLLRAPRPYFVFAGFVWALIAYTHRDNLRRLLHRTELRL